MKPIPKYQLPFIKPNHVTVTSGSGHLNIPLVFIYTDL